MTTDAASRERAFHDEVLPHLDAVYRFALRLAGEADVAEDLVQETFLRAWRAFDQYERGSRARSWLFTICRNVFLRQVERSQRHSEIVEAESPRNESVINPLWTETKDADPEGRFFGRLVDDEVLGAIDALPEEFRTAVVLSDLEGLNYQEIGEVLDVPVGTVKSRLFRGRRRLQKALYDYAVEMGYVAPSEAAG